MRDALTLVLNGELSLPEFAKAVGYFNELVKALANELAAEATIEWLVDSLESGSAIATIRGVSETPDAVIAVVKGYEAVGVHLRDNTPIPYSAKVVNAARSLTSVLDGKITSLQFETQDEEIEIMGRRQSPPRKLSSYLGTLKGTVQTMSRRRGVRFTLYDALFDRPISCYLKEGEEELIRDKWGKKVLVTGLISRDIDTGRPSAIHQITGIRLVESSPGSYKRARGILRLPEGETPEGILRELRDDYS